MDTKVYTFAEFVKESYDVVFEQGLSNITSKTILVGSSKKPTSSKSAIVAFKKTEELKDVKIEGDLTKEGALFRDSPKKQGGKKDFYYAKKTLKGTDYIKIDDEIIDGDKGETVFFKTTFKDLLDKNIEASGNGIYTIARLWKLYRLKDIGMDDEIILALDMKRPGGFIANVQTGFQMSVDNYASACLYMLLKSDTIIPNPNNQQDTVKRFLNSEKSIDNYFMQTAMPYFEIIPKDSEESKDIRKKLREKLIEKGSIDISKTLKEISDEKINSTKEGKKIDNVIKKITDSHLKDYVDLIAERFKMFFNINAEEVGVPKELFSSIIQKIDSWKNSEIDKNKKKYVLEVKERVTNALLATTEKSGDPIKGTKTDIKQIKRGEGEI
jgi:hypothetical protein